MSEPAPESAAVAETPPVSTELVAPESPWAPHPDRIELEAFAGPLELLLHLAKRHEVDLHEIPVAQVADQYVERLAAAQRDGRIDIDDAADFLVLAATLIEIKARAIAPTDAAVDATDGSDAEGGADPASPAGEDGTTAAAGAAAPIDPRYELVRQLLAYQAYREAARKLAERAAEWAGRAPARATPPEDPAESAEARSFDLDDANVADLASTWERLLESVGHGPGPHQVEYDDTPISLHADDLADRMQREGSISLQGVFAGRRAGERVGLFLAALELVRNRRARVRQEDIAGPIVLEPRDADEAEADTPGV
ncbi:MAG: segregation/condensation protein A, partial [Planctomycetota bacterium]